MAERKKGLGTGLNVLFGDEIPDSKEKDGALMLPISKVEPRQEQPRSVFEEEALQELASSIAQYGVIQPITVRKLDSGYYQIIAGERRWRASRLAGLTEVPVRVIEADDRRTAELALVENLQREDLNPMEEATGYKSLMEDYGLTQDEAARSVGKSRSAVANSMRLLALSKPVAEYVQEGKLSAGHARAILAVTDESEQNRLAMQVMKQGLSVRKTEILAAKTAHTPPAAKKSYDPSDPGAHIDYAADVSLDLTKVLARKCRLIEGKRTGRIEIEYYDPNDREDLITNLYQMGKSWNNWKK